jgi:hypothetical protein
MHCGGWEESMSTENLTSNEHPKTVISYALCNWDGSANQKKNYPTMNKCP